MTVTTRLSDVIVPTVYLSYDTVENIELTALYDSGIIVRSSLLDTLANSGGTTIHIPFWKDLDQTIEPNGSTDDPDVLAAAQKIPAGEMSARTAQLNQAWSAADLVSELAGSDPMKRIRARVDTYWNRQWQRRLIATALGIRNENTATGSGGSVNDMVYDASIADGVNATDSNLFSRGAFTAAVFTLGDQWGRVGAIAVHSMVMKRMVDNDDIQFIQPSKDAIEVPIYMGKRVIVDDSMPVEAGGTSGFVYTSIIFGGGAFGYGEGSPRVPVEVWRQPQAGNGGGVEQLWTRKTWLIHPFGYKWLDAVVTGQSPTLANLRNAANWQRQIARKNIPLAFIKTNG
jgi:hypothetical protein